MIVMPSNQKTLKEARTNKNHHALVIYSVPPGNQRGNLDCHLPLLHMYVG